MIKINLLPHKRLKPVDKSIMKLKAIVVVVTAAVVLVLGWSFYSLAAKKGELESKLDQTTQQLGTLKQKIKEVEGYEKSRKELEEKLRVISALDKKKVPMTLLLSELNASTTRDVWFAALKSEGPSFTLDGMSRDGRKGVDAYFQRLKSNPAFADLKLDDSKEDPTQGAGVFVFKVSGRLAGFDIQQPPQQPAPAPGGKPGSNKPTAPAGNK